METNPIEIAAMVAIVVVAITTHEAAHAWVADRLGDPTARSLGRVTLNPLPHIDFFMTILLPLLLVLTQAGVILGGAKPVPINPNRFRRPSLDSAITGAAGPVSNLLQAVLWAGVLSVFLNAGLWTQAAAGIRILEIGIFANVLLAVFNLVPIPPLDGSRVLMHFLKGEARAGYMRLEPFGIFIILGLFLFVPGFRYLLWSGIAFVATGICLVLGLPEDAWVPTVLMAR